ncbi:uncharacterized protein CC84DRAFT_1166689 [Paraphaeosphaeria sporulosa]|uniref:Uncharacterized protein n=1 Tax=Paraphaeosphaeria sporulosa TaxID=1460663 RepID=A0A177C7R3_9PLEO|nr:uncharacterized protein CC84DRAFT_1166689 [Paraphaeosphaeria sporulosa]OAG02892.1 hypothetical protein CC84DRAFT_1166689 [Paraphaeosphaeria sporulosa]
MDADFAIMDDGDAVVYAVAYDVNVGVIVRSVAVRVRRSRTVEFIQVVACEGATKPVFGGCKLDTEMLAM